MAGKLKQYQYYLILLIFCVDQGDGRWKKIERQVLEHDIELYEKIAEKVEDELRAYYEYADDDLDNYYTDSNDYFNTKKMNYRISKRRNKISSPTVSSKSEHVIERSNNELKSITKTIQGQVKNNIVESKSIKNKWPKFEDIVFAIGKRYDWKNDRWIKVKEKFKATRENEVKSTDKNVILHEKHNFIYRRVKLNKGKSRRNVVIAVTAVR